jgi:signal transduction histidine kinase
MRLADFIEHRLPQILEEWENFARTLMPASAQMDSLALRDHAEEMLRDIAQDLRTTQSRAQQRTKSWGEKDAAHVGETPSTAAQLHGSLRAAAGISIQQLVAEFRALRASVLQLYADEADTGAYTIHDIGRFNEAIDQAIAESAQVFQDQIEHWRDLFLAVLQHDLRGPMQAVMASAQVLGVLPPGAEREQVAARLKRGGERMKALLDELLDLNRVTLNLGLPMNRVHCDLVPACLEELELRRAAHPGHHIGWTTSGSAVGVWDASRVQQALGNLIANAAKHGDARGTIEVELHGTADEVCIAVSNQGPAISPEVIDAIFEPLRRVEDPANDDQTHMGLGLFVVREVAKAHGGDVVVDSSPSGTRFSLHLPRSS